VGGARRRHAATAAQQLSEKEERDMKTMRTCRQVVRLAVFLAAVILAASWSWAAEQTIRLSADKAGAGAGGEVVLRDAAAGMKEIAITVTGLKPGGVYTVWFVTMSPTMAMAGIGKADYVLPIDRRGSGSYRATVSAADLTKWQAIEIAYHKTGDPKDMRHIVGALQGALAPGGGGM
jgi:hypothetical protein